MTNNNYQQKVDAIKELLEVFSLERHVYISITLISFLALLACAASLLFRSSGNTIEIIGLFGSSGGITYTSSRFLAMWSHAIKLLHPGIDGSK